LKASNLTVRFGGLVAVDNVSLEAPTGRITGLIGPNGAGKSTTFNACSGLLRPTAGTVHLNGTDLTHQSPQARARYGLGGAFQKMELFDSLTVLDNVAFGREGAYADTRPWRHLLSTRAEREQVAASAAGSLELRGIHHLAFVLLDEVSMGLAPKVVEEIFEFLRLLAAEGTRLYRQLHHPRGSPPPVLRRPEPHHLERPGRVRRLRDVLQQPGRHAQAGDLPRLGRRGRLAPRRTAAAPLTPTC